MYKRFFNKCEICCFIQGACSEQFQTFLNEGVSQYNMLYNSIFQNHISGNYICLETLNLLSAINVEVQGA
jgi:hypothetical protein